ncbi:hypothetical protein IFM89_025294 [Coptis chinensis]|uniref:Uncharacterized protein n=1 Tax=Coptis chinensis TaxID=261450 RepID=A0A835HWG3_9MAGN|nr:hypothetical protein IFM89_025294 [Coptis chinensis]
MLFLRGLHPNWSGDSSDICLGRDEEGFLSKEAVRRVALMVAYSKYRAKARKMPPCRYVSHQCMYYANITVDDFLTRVFVSAKKLAKLSGYGAIPRCLQNVPSEAQLLATAAEVQDLIVSGKRLEALQYAQEGQFWGFTFHLAVDLALV